MAPIRKKRSRSERAQSLRKRQNTGNSKHVSQTEDTDSIAIAVDKLPWSTVPLPDRLEDAEGFYGLEEIADIEIVRDSKASKLEYRVASSRPKGINSRNLNDKTAPKLLTDQNHRKTKDEVEDEDEWKGFGSVDLEEESSTFILPETTLCARNNGLTLESGENKTKKKPREKDKHPRMNGQESLPANTFEVLQDATFVEADVSAWKPLGLSSRAISSIARLGFTSPTPIQMSAIPEILNGHDVIGKAVTGSGKTLAFGIPILEHYLRTRDGEEIKAQGTEIRQYPPVALILLPTRELAHQISTHMNDLCSTPLSTGPSIATLTGGLSLHKQKRLLAKADIIIGTPGRLWETISESYELMKWLRSVKYIVADEADRLLSEGHFKEVEEILNALDRKDDDQESGYENDIQHQSEPVVARHERQTLVFSATFQKNLQQKLVGRAKSSSGNLLDKHESMEYLLKKLNFREEKPKFIDVNPVSQMASKLKEGIVECGGLEKDLYLYALLLYYPNTRTLIFTNSITSVRRLTPFLQNLNIPVYALHSQMAQKARLRSVEKFSDASSPSSILVATDVAARGLDIPFVQLIIHYHLPRAADMYVHRSGRTARAAESGSSILLCAPEEVLGVRRLVAKVHAQNATPEESKKTKFFMRTIDLNRRIIACLKPRVILSKKISDASLAKEKKGQQDNWLKTAADDLGVDYDSEEFAAGEGSKKGRGQGRKKAEKAARELTKAELGALRGELKQLLSQRVNVGVSERYLTAGGVDVDELLSGERRTWCFGQTEDELHGGFQGRRFKSRCSPVVTLNTIIIAICGPNDFRNNASPKKDGWIFSDFYLFHHLFRGTAAEQHCMTCVSPEALVHKYEEYAHGDPRSKNGRIVLDASFKDEVKDVNVFEAQDLLKKFESYVLEACKKVKDTPRPILVLIFGHGKEEKFSITIGGKGEFEDCPQLTIHRLKQLIYHCNPTPNVTLVTTSCYGGGWIQSSLINITAMSGTTHEANLLSWPVSGSQSRVCGSKYATGVAQALINREINLDPASDDYQQIKASSTYAALAASVREILTTQIDVRISNQISFAAQDDLWDTASRARTGFPLTDYEEKWESLRQVESGTSSGVSHNASVRFSDDVRLSTPEAVVRLKRLASEYQASNPGPSAAAKSIPINSDCRTILNGEHLSDEELEYLAGALRYRLETMDQATAYKGYLGLSFPDCREIDVYKFTDDIRQDEEKYKIYQKVYKMVDSGRLFDTPGKHEGMPFAKGGDYIRVALVDSQWGPKEVHMALDRLYKLRNQQCKYNHAVRAMKLWEDGDIRKFLGTLADSTGKRLRSLSPRKHPRPSLEGGFPGPAGR